MQQLAFYKEYVDLISLIQKSGRGYNIELIDRAYNLANQAHGDQKRVSGLPYILHPVSVAYILVNMGMDTDSIVAALLHDVVEDTDIDLKQIQKKFGSSIANLISGLTKIGKIPLSTKEQQQAENLRKMLIAMASDIRVIIIKLADRLHNMRTIDCLPEYKSKDKAKETMEIYAPIAHRLGMRAIKEELEDISIRCLDPFAYQEIEQMLAMRKSAREEFICSIKKRLSKRLFQVIPNVSIEGRVKSINGIYRKIYQQNHQIEEVYDIYAVRIIVDTENDCYNVLGIVHDVFRPVPNRFKDYISTPKPNLYRSLHTTVIGKEGIPFEVQIRNWEMHYTAEYGIAAHWKYKLGISKNKDSLEQRLVWVRQMIENQIDSQNSTDLIANIKSDLTQEEVYVFTPKGDVISLPTGSSIIDFAYAIHSEVGHKMVSAKVNQKTVAIESKIKNGEIIEIITTKDPQKGPKRDWLALVITSEAKNKIRQWFKRERKEENIIVGKRIVDREFKRNHIKLPEEKMTEFLKAIAKRQRCSSIEQFYESIGYGAIQLENIIPYIKEEYSKIQKNNVTEIKSMPVPLKKNKSGVAVESVQNCLIRFAKCCNPLPGDDIIGFITKGYGVSIHKSYCTNIQKNMDPERLITVNWEHEVKRKFKCNIEILVNGRPGLLADIASKLSEMHIGIYLLNAREISPSQSLINFTITVNSLGHLQKILNKLKTVDGVVKIKRS